MRAIAQKCPQGMKNLITFGGQHQGVYGLPKCGANHIICDYVRRLLNYGAYTSWVQDKLVQAQYWHDPLDNPEYQAKSVFLGKHANTIFYLFRLLNIASLARFLMTENLKVVPSYFLFLDHLLFAFENIKNVCLECHKKDKISMILL